MQDVAKLERYFDERKAAGESIAATKVNAHILLACRKFLQDERSSGAKKELIDYSIEDIIQAAANKPALS